MDTNQKLSHLAKSIEPYTTAANMGIETNLDNDLISHIISLRLRKDERVLSPDDADIIVDLFLQAIRWGYAICLKDVFGSGGSLEQNNKMS